MFFSYNNFYNAQPQDFCGITSYMYNRRRAITPGYEWQEISFSNSTLQSSPTTLPHSIDLKNLFPLPDNEVLQQTWENRQSRTLETTSGTKIHTLTFNARALGGTIFWLPGWGVTSRWNGGARVATTIAAMNPDKVVRTADELRHVPKDQKIEAMRGNMYPYTSNYMFAIDDRLDDLDTLSGHSRGGIIQAHLASHGDMPNIKTINLIDMPKARNYATAAGFVFRIGVLDNLKNNQQRELSDSEEEAMLQSIIPNRQQKSIPEWMVSYDKAQRQWWLLRALAREGLKDCVESAMKNQPYAELYWWHGTRNVGAPVKSTRKLIHELRNSLNETEREKIHYFEAPTGHYSVGHTARYARQTAHAIDQSNT